MNDAGRTTRKGIEAHGYPLATAARSLTTCKGFAIFEGMEHTEQHDTRSIDVTGLPEEAVRAVELYVSQLRSQQVAGVPSAFASRAEWAKAVRQWAESHPRRETLADDSRETIYADDRNE
jgi:hypothetical protein